MTCAKKIVLTGYRVQLVDLREPKPRTPQEHIHVADLWQSDYMDGYNAWAGGDCA